ncbi:MAG: Hpt domain-containing protein [Sulfurimonas sp.]|uniref:Hpt domain-containing protein n=1 Tax=Sulfurimonas sp. TaxID=2022749 RepID=UPI00261C93AD|nr:Hpt domain-containing protein [Sulfurimonas sp.]MDD5372757.1 Hpt domain-containing protein [Sulfurimonas sp.]
MPILDADYSNIDHEEMAISIGIKPKHVPLLIASFFEETEIILNNLNESITVRDYDNIRLNAHSIKGSAGNLRFNEVYEMAKEIEFAAAEQKSNFEYESYHDAIKSVVGTISL